MRLNRAGQEPLNAAGQDPLRQRLAGLSPHPSGGIQTERTDDAALRDEARERLKAGSHARSRRTIRPGDGEAKARASKTWHLWVVFDILLLLLIVPLVVAVPPVLDCRKKQDETGFFVGNSFKKCARAGISERWTLLDSRLKMLVRNSGQ